MKIAVTATGPDLESQVDPRFGRCQYLMIVDPETMQFEALANSGTMVQGAGIATGQLVASKGVKAVLTGSCGPNAHQVLSAADIQVITGVSGSVRDAVGKYKSGQLKPSSEPDVPAHHGQR
jgi:predicted Fe-Mo cluster-binding NifX family protein